MVEHLRLGSTGMEVSETCLGGWMFGEESTSGSEIVTESQTRAILEAGWAAGVNFIDTANVMGSDGRSEEYIGGWLEGKDREDFVSQARCTSLCRDDYESA